MKLMIISLLLFINSISLLAKSPQEIVNNIFNTAKKVNIKYSLKQQATINKNFAFDTMALNILGNQVNLITPKENIWFQNTIKAIIIQTIYPEAPNFLKNVEISYEPQVKKNNKTIFINSIVKQKGEETEVSYKFIKISHEWKIIDIAIDDESWTEAISEQVKSVIIKEKWAGLKIKLNKRLKELNSDKK